MEEAVKIEELPDWQQRFVIEYKELLEKTTKLGNMLNNWDNLNFTPKCSKQLLTTQYNNIHIENFFSVFLYIYNINKFIVLNTVNTSIFINIIK